MVVQYLSNIVPSMPFKPTPNQIAKCLQYVKYNAKNFDNTLCTTNRLLTSKIKDIQAYLVLNEEYNIQI